MEKTLFTQSSSIGENMGVDDMQEAIEKGYLGGKLIAPKTIKFMDAMLDAVSVYAEAEGISDVDWMRNAIAEALLIADAKYERTRKAKERASKHWNTLAHQKESPVARTTELDVQNLGVNEQ